ncbi:MAG: Rieske 2Fe-2S domain-containing protein [Tenericutes bacterium]|nr:Rieske 2Fe-2S domain-containing protein [Mycoplasmatota bacterium]
MEYLVANLSTLNQKKKLRVQVKNRWILLTSNDSGIFAIQDKCPHMGSSLFSGRLQDGVITCKDHGLGISVETGNVTDERKAKSLRLDEYSLSVRKFKVVIRDNSIYIDL